MVLNQFLQEQRTAVCVCNDALNGVPDATLQAAINAAIFSFGGMIFFWSKKP